MPTIPQILGSRLMRYLANTVTASTWTDDAAIANATQGTSTRQPTVTTTPCGAAAVYFTPNRDFTGSNGDVMRMVATGASSTPDYTIIGCILRVFPNYATDGTGNGSGIFGIGSTRCNLYLYDLVDTKLRAAAFGASALAEQTTGRIDDGKWHRAMVVANQAADTVTLYVDGVAQTSTLGGDDGLGIDLSTTDVWIGAGDATAIAGLNGTVGHCFVGQSASSFSAAEIAALDQALLEQIYRLNFTFAGAVGTGTNATLARFPTGVTGGDVLALAVGGKYPAAFAMPTTPTGFSIVATGGATGGAGNPGADSGSVFANWYVRIADGLETGGVTCSVPSGNSMLAQMFRLSVASGYQVNSNLVRSTYGSDNTAGTTFVATLTANPDIRAGDLCLAAASVNTDARTASAQTMTCTGIGSWAAASELADNVTSLGDDAALVVSAHGVETGVSTGINPVFAMTLSGTAGNQGGGAVSLLRLRVARFYTMPATAVSFVASGVNATLTYGGGAPKSITAAVANFVASGVNATLTKQSKIVAAGTTYTLSGVAALLTKQSKIVAGQASFIASGPNAGLTKQSKIVAGSTTFLASGVDATLRRGATIAAASTTFLASGVAATLTKQSKIVAGQASFIVSGVDAAIAKSVYMTAAAASYVASGIDATLTKQSKIAAAVAPFVVSGIAAGLGVAMPAAVAPFVVSGIAAALSKQSKIVAAQASFIASGPAAGLYAGRKIVAAQASFIASGINATLTKQSKLTAAVAPFVVSGIDAGLSNAAGASIVAGTASFAIVGQDAALKRQLNFAAGVGALTVTGQAAGLTKQPKIVAAAGALSLIVADAGLYAGRKLTAAAGALTITGSATGLRSTRLLTATTASLAIVAQDANLRAARVIAAAAAAYTIAGQSVNFTRARAIAAATGAFTIVGNDAALAASRIFPAAAGALTITGNAANLTTVELSIVAASASLVVTGPDVGLVWVQYVPPRQVVIALERPVPLVRIDFERPVPLVRIDLERPVPLVRIELGEPPMSLRVGAVCVLTITTRILGRTANPDSLYVVVTSPSGVATTYTFGTSAAVEYIPDDDDPTVETGRYRARIPCTEASTPGSPWTFTWYTGGDTVGVESGEFTVDPV